MGRAKLHPAKSPGTRPGSSVPGVETVHSVVPALVPELPLLPSHSRSCAQQVFLLWEPSGGTTPQAAFA
ncbi:hypothetical protein Nmel_013393 [Mimus melanotis]